MFATQKKDRFSVLFESYSRDVFRYIYVRTRNQSLADDITQNVFTKVYKNMNHIDSGTERSYIITAAKNALVDYYRSAHRTVSYDESVPAHNPLESGQTSDYSASIQDQELVKRVLAMMDDDDAEVIQLRALQQWEYSEIAYHYGMSESSVRKRYSRALEKFSQSVHSHYQHQQ